MLIEVRLLVSVATTFQSADSRSSPSGQ
jgi:hypothetical protein